jgi:hypothetical protein
LFACHAHDPENGSRATTLAGVIDAMATQSTVVFGLTYSADLPDGVGLEAYANAESDMTCAKAAAGTGTDWTLVVSLPRASSGEFGVVRGCASSDSQATVRFVRSDTDEYQRYCALGGKVELQTTSDGYQLHVRADFDVSGVRSLGCTGGAAINSTVKQSTTAECECADDAMHLWTCSAENAKTCCLEDAAADLKLDVSLRGNSCPELCSFDDPALANHCANVN